ncbi:MAG: shikimate kinase [Oscillospiraceae bacterium]|jgi:shikimate dehydrogenase|nr:shikimate kinase [Oscillospiraceae bacterium]
MIEFGLVGETLSHSHSPRIHRALGDYSYELIEVDPTGLDRLLRERAFRGLNVTIPYKVDAMGYCDALTDEAREIGSVNTLTFDRQNRLWGHNTDLYGFETMARNAGISLTDRKVLILGSGGSCRTATAAAKRAGAREIVVVSRSGRVDYDAAKRLHSDADVIVNTTPVGMYPNNGNAPISLSDFPQCAGVLDLVYNPLRTALLLDAMDRGIPHADGLTMLAAQALRASELFTNTAIDADRVGMIVADIRSQLSNITIIGMPGSGKSVVGCALARRFSRPFVDLDKMIETRAGKTIPEIFAESGETVFREIERAAAADVGKRGGQIIAAGGGAALDQRNVDAFRQNGRLLYLRRPLESLERSGRPLSTGFDALAEMERVRLPIYKKVSDAVVDNAGSLPKVIERAEAVVSDLLYL